MGIHDRAANTALRLIKKHGRDVVLKKLSRTPADPAKPWRGGGSTFEAEVTVRAVMVAFDNDEVDGTAVRRTDQKLLVAAKSSDQDLLPFDKLLDGGKLFGLSGGRLVKPGETAILYQFTARA